MFNDEWKLVINSKCSCFVHINTCLCNLTSNYGLKKPLDRGSSAAKDNVILIHEIDLAPSNTKSQNSKGHNFPHQQNKNHLYTKCRIEITFLKSKFITAFTVIYRNNGINII